MITVKKEFLFKKKKQCISKGNSEIHCLVQIKLDLLLWLRCKDFRSGKKCSWKIWILMTVFSHL